MIEIRKIFICGQVTVCFFYCVGVNYVSVFLDPVVQGSYASGKCQGNLKFFKIRELSGNFIISQGKLNFC